MSLTARIARNTLQQLFGKFFSIGLAFVGFAVLARYLGQTGFGQYTTAVVFAGFFGTLADLGIYIVTVKKISEAGADEERVFSNLFTLRVVSALVFVGLAPLVVLFFPYPSVVKWGVAIATFSTLFVALSQLFTGLFQKHLRMANAAVSEVVGRAVYVALIILFVAVKAPLLVVFGVVTASALAQCALQWYFASRILPIRFRFDRDVWGATLRESWPVAVTIALNLIYFRADTIILSLFHPAATVGVYGANYKVLEVLVSFPAMFAGLVLPLLTRHVTSGDDERFRGTFQRAFDFLAIVALPIVAGLFMLAHPIMALTAGPEFRVSGSILRVLVFAAGIIFFGNLFGNTIVALGRQRAMMKYYAVVAACALVGYFLFIPRYGMWGASGMTVATELAITLSSFVVVWKARRVRLSLRQFSRALLASVLMIAALVPLRTASLPLAIAVGGAVYAIALFVLGGIRKHEIVDMLRIRTP